VVEEIGGTVVDGDKEEVTDSPLDKDESVLDQDESVLEREKSVEEERLAEVDIPMLELAEREEDLMAVLETGGGQAGLIM
jgi:hypothetical protein